MVERGIAGDLLGRHVARRSDALADPRDPAARRDGQRGVDVTVRGAVEGLGDAEVGDARAAATQQDILRLHVAVHDTLGVRVVERAGDVAQDRHGLGERHAVGCVAQPVAHRGALDERHDVVGHAVRDTGGEHGDDVRVLEPRGELDLASEPLGAQVGAEARGERLDDDRAA